MTKAARTERGLKIRGNIREGVAVGRGGGGGGGKIAGCQELGGGRGGGKQGGCHD